MGNRVFRLSISPEELPEVRRVIDFDGRSSLADVHRQIQSSYGLGGADALYGFFMSGRAWDAASAYMDPRAEGRRADKALLFRLELSAGKSFAYLCDFEDERHFSVKVVSLQEVAQPLPAPQLVEALGEAPVSAPRVEATAEQDPPELAELVELAEDFLDLDDELEEFADELESARARLEPWGNEDAALGSLSGFKAAAPEAASDENWAEAAAYFRDTAAAARKLVAALAGSVERFLKLDEWLLSRALGPRLLDLPMTLAFANQTELGLALARDMVFIDPELLQGDIAVMLARAGRRDEALRQVDQNLETARDAALVEAKAGDAYRALGDLPAAEAYYRRSLSVAKTSSDRLHALLRLVTCLTDAGRDAEAAELLKEARRERGEPEKAAAVVVGRNEPCPCGSGKKYKKCHGAGG
jgi:tetratricopeptide (TPR) repeat protein